MLIANDHQIDPKGEAIAVMAAAPMITLNTVESFPKHHPPSAAPHSVVAKTNAVPLTSIEMKSPTHKIAGSKTNPKGIKNAARLNPKADQLVAITGAFPTAAAANEAKPTGGVIIERTQ